MILIGNTRQNRYVKNQQPKVRTDHEPTQQSHPYRRRNLPIRTGFRSRVPQRIDIKRRIRADIHADIHDQSKLTTPRHWSVPALERGWGVGYRRDMDDNEAMIYRALMVVGGIALCAFIIIIWYLNGMVRHG